MIMIISVTMPVSKYREGSSWEYDCAWHQLRTLRKNLGEAGGTSDIFWNHLCVAHIVWLYSFEHFPSQTTSTLRLLDCLV